MSTVRRRLRCGCGYIANKGSDGNGDGLHVSCCCFEREWDLSRNDSLMGERRGGGKSGGIRLDVLVDEREKVPERMGRGRYIS
jgi:hypothetical protein